MTKQFPHLGEIFVPELDKRSCREHPVRAHGKRALVQTVKVTHHQEQIRRLLHREETASRNIYTCIKGACQVQKQRKRAFNKIYLNGNT